MIDKRSLLTRYRQTPLNTPVFHFISELLASFVSLIYWFRWQFSRPFQTRVLPKWTPRITIPGFAGLTYLTYGEVILSFPLIFLCCGAYYYCFVEPDVAASGNVSSYFIIYGVLLANKSSSIFSCLLGIPFERLIFYHKLTACLALVIGVIHTIIAFEFGRGSTSLASFAFSDLNNSLGSLITICLAGFILTSLFPFFRRRFYDAWLFTHIFFLVAAALPWAAHSINMVWLPLFWWVLDIFVRYVLMARCYYARSATLRKLRPNVVEVRFRKPRGFQYNPGQFARICIPKITSFQFHPFSLSSAPHEDYVTLHIRGLGNWTDKVVKLAEEEDGQEVDILMEGPYGSLSVDLNDPRYGMVLCVCGGIGVTHCRSVARSVVNDHIQHGRQLEQLRFIWAVRHYDLVEDLPPFEGQNISARPDLEGGYQVSVTVEEPKDGLSTVDDCLSNDGFDDDVSSAPLVPTSIQAEVYMTNDKKNAKEELDIKSNDQQVVIQSGRPNLDLIVEDMRLEALKRGVTHVAAFGCGPKPLIDALREACRKQSKGAMDCQGVTFDLHVETFEF